MYRHIKDFAVLMNVRFLGLTLQAEIKIAILMFNKIPTDKQLHLLVCFIIALVAWLFAGPLIPDWPIVCAIVIRAFIAFALATVFAIAKELLDSAQKGNHLCRKDLLWDAIGSILGCAVGIVHLSIS